MGRSKRLFDRQSSCYHPRSPNPREPTAKAVVRTKYGPPSEALPLKEAETPVLKDDAALVRAQASSVDLADRYLTRRKPFPARLAGSGLWRPKSALRGADVAGTVTAVADALRYLHEGHPRGTTSITV